MDPGYYERNREENPRSNASWLSKFTCWWLKDLFTKGLHRPLKIDDLYNPLNEHAADALGDQHEELWFQELKKEKPSLLRVLMRIHGVKLILFNMLRMTTEMTTRITQPLCLGMLIAYFKPNQSEISTEEAYLYAFGILFCMISNVFLLQPFFVEVMLISMKIKVACSSLMYRKVLRLDCKTNSSVESSFNGRIINLLTNDVNRFDSCCVQLLFAVMAPIEGAIIVYIMYLNVGYTCFIGVAFLLLFIPLQVWLSKLSASLRKKSTFKTDNRIKMMNEVIEGIQLIKMYAWEYCFSKIIKKLRMDEMKLIRKINWSVAVTLCCSKLNIKISIFISVIAYIFFEGQISAANIFVMFSLYNVMKRSIVKFFPLSLMNIMDAYVSVKRIEEFLLLPEVKNQISKSDSMYKQNIIKFNNYDNSYPIKRSACDHFKEVETFKSQIPNDDVSKVERNCNEPVISLLDVSVTWCNNDIDVTENGKSNNITLDKISLKIFPGKLIAIVGRVGSGKSTLLNTFINEAPLSSGSVQINGSVSYCSQTPWIFEASIRQNIIFGQKINMERYREVIKCCQLENDLKMFPYGDKTIIGERGITLSGGQRARISLARCIYKTSDIYLLDDPLSAVDSNVARKLLNECLCGFLNSKTIVLVTHHIHHLHVADEIYVLNLGKIIFSGSYDTFQKSENNNLNVDLFPKVENIEKEDKSVDFEYPEFLYQKGKDGTITSKHSQNVSLDGLLDKQRDGSVSIRIYKALIYASGKLPSIIFLFLLFCLSQVSESLADIWISKWINFEEVSNSKVFYGNITNEYTNNTNGSGVEAWLTNNWIAPFLGSNPWNLNRNNCIYIYSVIIIMIIVLTMSKFVFFLNTCIRASINLHDQMFKSVTRTTMHFFNTNSSGRIINRFSKDIGAVDTIIPLALLDCLTFLFETTGVLIVVCITNVWLLIPTCFIVVILTVIRAIYLATSRSLRRLEGICRSPAFTHMNATMNGLDTIRSSRLQNTLTHEFDEHLNLHTSVWTLIVSTNRAFAFWVDISCCTYLAFVTYSFLFLNHTDVTGSNVGLAITQAINLVGMCQWGMRQTAQVESQMICVERIIEYIDLKSEASLETDVNSVRKIYPNKDINNWPEYGDLDLKNVYLKYDESLNAPDVLKDVNFIVKSGEKVGIVGRTGAGKSSLIAALFRLAPTRGFVVMDGIDTSVLGLRKLRSSMSIIPQEPMLFSGTLRQNLDPWGQYNDAQMWDALEDVELKNTISNMPNGLNSHIADGGKNFSVGERQLFCLARAILRDTKYILLDEATANVDTKTDSLIQKTIARKFAGKTVLTIAHRLYTVMDSDKILFMHQGNVVEYDHPYMLLKYTTKEQSNHNVDNGLNKVVNLGIFREFVEKTDKNLYDLFLSIAKKNYEERSLVKKHI